MPGVIPPEGGVNLRSPLAQAGAVCDTTVQHLRGTGTVCEMSVQHLRSPFTVCEMTM